MADPTEVGKYGTIRLLKRRDPSGVVAAYPIDDEEVSFGRDASCSVRLYYSEVSHLHCKIIFEERKAFLQVFGASGVIVDSCPVYPVKSAIPGDPSTTVTVPLPNGSVFEIHKKRFMFNYPPKALRPQLFTPATTRRKSIRMSLVQSAQVFSPAPSPYPRENLRVLQSPLKLPSSEAPVKLVDGDHPRVYEEEQDLVILEDVEPHQNGILPSPIRLQTLPPVRQVPPQTPRRRSQPSLHRAVLIRSAQRTAYMRESQTQTQGQYDGSGTQFEEINLEDEDADGEDEDDEDSDDEEDEEDEVINSILNISGESEEDASSKHEAMNGMAIDVAWDAEFAQQIKQQDTVEVKEEFDEELNEEGRFTTPLQVSRALHLGAFMTPQPGLFANRPDDNQNERRRTGPQRPPPGFRFSLAPGLGSTSMIIKEEDMDEKASSTPLSPSKRREISEEERKAILDRRRSALKQPDPEIGERIFKSGERDTTSLPPPLPPPTSPFKTLSTHIEEGEDTQVVLQRMQAQVAERRASLSPTRPRIARDAGSGMFPPSPTKTFSLLASAARLKSPIREMPDFEEGMLEMQNQTQKQYSMEVDDESDMPTNRDEDVVQENDENACLTNLRSETPRLDGVREMFRAPSTAAGLSTPAVRGVRDLFRAPQALQTPRMQGMRELFAEKHAQETPDFDGIGDMMHVDEQGPEQDSKIPDKSGEKSILTDVPEDDGESPESANVRRPASTRKLPLATRTLQRSRGTRPTLIRTRGTPTDASTMADDEATPDSDPVDLPNRIRPGKDVPEAAVVHRGGRARRGTAVQSDTETSKSASPRKSSTEAAKSPPRRGRAVRSITEETEGKEENKAPTKPPSKTRGRRKLDPVTPATDSDAVTDTASQPVKRGRRADSAQPDEATLAPTPSRRRGTRTRSRSAELDSDVDASDVNTRAGARTRATTVETIPEEEEPTSAQAKPVRKASAPPTTRNRRTRTRTDSSAEDAPPKKRAGTAKNSVVDSAIEETSHLEDKENTPDTSPVSESGEDSSTRPVKTASKGRAGAKGAPASKTKAGLGKTKIPSRAVKVKTEDEDSAPVPRATRARARK